MSFVPNKAEVFATTVEPDQFSYEIELSSKVLQDLWYYFVVIYFIFDLFISIFWSRITFLFILYFIYSFKSFSFSGLGLLPPSSFHVPPPVSAATNVVTPAAVVPAASQAASTVVPAADPWENISGNSKRNPSSS